MRFNPNALFAALLGLAIFSSCKEIIDFQADTCYPVQQLLDSKNADVACNEKADFEGSILCLSGNLEVSNDPHALPGNFFLLDPVDSNRSVEVQLDSNVAVAVIPLVRANRGQAAKVKGVLSGNGQPGNPDCRRAFVLTLVTSSDFELENSPDPTPPSDSINLETAVWQLTAIVVDHTPMQVPDTLPVPMTVKFSAGKVEGYGGCNNFGGTFTAGGDQLSVSGLFSTRRFCEGISEWENKFLRGLEQSKSYKITGETLEIDCGEAGGLVFRLNWKKRKGE